MRRARDLADVVVVSLFVNPTQFVADEDYDRYPRNEKDDLAKAEEAGVDLVFAPSREEMYPDSCTTVHVAELSEVWEGAFRPGHFDGVATIVAKLFNIVRPDVALFGLKDFQQCRVIDQMVQDLNIPVELKFEETARDAYGLALSSRNAYLNTEERMKAPMLHRALTEIAQTARESRAEVDHKISEVKIKLSEAGFKLDYLELIDAQTLLANRSKVENSRVIVAAKLGTTRLIDNVAV